MSLQEERARTDSDHEPADYESAKPTAVLESGKTKSLNDTEKVNVELGSYKGFKYKSMKPYNLKLPKIKPNNKQNTTACVRNDLTSSCYNNVTVEDKLHDGVVDPIHALTEKRGGGVTLL